MFRSMGGAAFGSLFKATDFTTQTSNITLTVPNGANAIHIQAAVGGGASGVNGFSYDKSGGESAGTAGGSGAYVSDKVFSVSQGETLTLIVGAGGTGNTGGYPNQQGVDGENTVLSGSSTGSIFTLGAGEAGGSTGGSSPNGSVRTNLPSAGGTATIDGTTITSGTFIEANGASVTFATATTLNQGPVGIFDQSGNGEAGFTGNNCSGDNCRVDGSVGGDSYADNIAGGTAGTASGAGTAGGDGTRGSGGGGGAAQVDGGGFTLGGDGGDGEIIYRFIKVL